MVPQNRQDDISFRGDIDVHDYNGSIIKLSKAKVWYNYDGDYVLPRTYEQEVCCIFEWLNKFLCITI